MKGLHLIGLSAAMAALLIFAAAKADAQQRAVGGGPRISLPSPTFHPRLADGALRSAPPSHGHHFSWEGKHGFHGGFGGGVWIVEQEVPVIIEREVVREVPAPPVAVAPPTPRKPYVIGSTYASLPDSCMKLIEEGASYYYCSGGEWYRQVGKQYRAIERKL